MYATDSCAFTSPSGVFLLFPCGAGHLPSEILAGSGNGLVTKIIPDMAKVHVATGHV